MAIAVTGALAATTAFIALAPERGLQLLFEDRLDEIANPAPDAVLQRIAPVVAQQWKGGGLGGSLLHGVISTAAATAVSWLGFQIRRLRQPQFSTTFATPPP